MKKNFFVSGEWNITCDVCSKKIKAQDALHRWDGLIVCRDDYEMRHEQDFVKARQDKITVPYTRPKETPVFNLLAPVFDTTTVADSMQTVFESNQNPTDSVVATDNLQYTFSKYLVDQVFVDDSLTTQGAGYYSGSDNTPATDSGSLTLHNYVDPAYFEEVYVGSVTTF